MYQTFEEDDLFYDSAEGPSQLRYSDDLDGAEEDEFLGSVLGTLGRVAGGLLGADDYDALDEGYDEDAFEEDLADALEAEDSDEFFRRIRRLAQRVGRGVGRAARTVGRVARTVGRGVGQVARVVGPIASLIPLPQAQLIGRLANVAGRLLADGVDEFEALDELYDLAEAEDGVDAAAPLISTIAIRSLIPNVSRLPRTTRRQLIRGVTQATRQLTRRQGPQAARAMPRIVQGVQRTARQRRTPVQAIPRLIQQTASRVAQSPTSTRRLAQPLTRRAAPAGGTCPTCGRRHHYSIQGPVQLTIRGR